MKKKKQNRPGSRESLFSVERKKGPAFRSKTSVCDDVRVS